jgi:PAS domain S-box-containing protein
MSGAKRILAIFIFAAVLVAATTFSTYTIGLVALQQNQMSAEARFSLQQLEELISTLKDLETGQRGYLLTGEEKYLEPYRQALARVDRDLEQLRQLARKRTLPTNTVERIAQLSQLKLAELNETIQQQRAHGLEAALMIVRSDRGKKLMDELRDQIGRMQSLEQAAFFKAMHAARLTAIWRTAIFVAGGLANLAFLGWAFRNVSDEITRREAAVTETTRQKELLSTTLASIGDGVIITDSKGHITFLNTEAQKLTGWSISEAHGRPLPEVFQIVNEATRKPVENPVDKVLRLGTVVGLANHTILIARDGRETPIDDSAAPIRVQGGPLEGVVLVFRDFTEQKNAEEVLTRSKDELEQLVAVRTAKLQEMISELQHVSYAITHDMRAPLRAMSAFTQILSEEAPSLSPEAADYCRRIGSAANRLDKLIEDTLSYTRTVQEDLKLEPVDLSRLLRGLIETYPNLQSDKADIEIEGELPVVLGNEALLTQCFSNLLGNAVKFVALGVRPRVRIQSEKLDHSIRIWIIDNGIGIAEQYRERIFHMFQRLSNEYEGTGIGLAIVRKVTERMGGGVGVESEPGQGSRFWITLRVPA